MKAVLAAFQRHPDCLAITEVTINELQLAFEGAHCSEGFSWTVEYAYVVAQCKQPLHDM
jgi:hypothetical protein